MLKKKETYSRKIHEAHMVAVKRSLERLLETKPSGAL